MLTKLAVVWPAIVALGLLPAATIASAESLSGTYNVMAENDPDYRNFGFYALNSSLGPNGLPAVNAGSTLNDVNAQGEITWWSPSMNGHVTSSGTGTISLPFSDFSMYPPQGQNPLGNDANGVLTAEFTGVLTVPTSEQVTFNLGSDDESFLYLNGVLVKAIQGIHPYTTATAGETLGPGTYALTLFYDDRDQSQAALTFSVDGSGISVSPSSSVPEPAAMGMLALATAVFFAVFGRLKGQNRLQN